MQRFEYGYEDGLRGVEAKILINDDNQMFIKIVGSNHWRDYLENLLAWPRVRPVDDKKVKTHRVWTRQAWGLSVFVNDLIEKYGISELLVIGHSSGGAVASLLPIFIKRHSVNGIYIRTVNAPKAGNSRANIKAFQPSTLHYGITRWYDGGDIVRRFPLLYKKPLAVFDRDIRYASTKPFWKAHNNMPYTWKKFPV